VCSEEGNSECEMVVGKTQRKMPKVVESPYKPVGTGVETAGIEFWEVLEEVNDQKCAWKQGLYGGCFGLVETSKRKC